MLRKIFFFFARLLRPFICTVVWRAIKIKQYPAILRDRVPKFFLDETCRPAMGGNYVIFAMTGAWGIGEDTFMLFNLLRDMGIDTLLVINGTLNTDDLDKARQCVNRIMVRKNLGRDFGAYRAAVLKLYEEKVSCRRVIFLNDSIYYLNRPTLRELIECFIKDSPYDVVAATENQEFSHHIASFALSMTDKIFHDVAIKKYWEKYRPYNLRIHAIHAGERLLSKVSKRINARVNVVYGLERLTQIIADLPIEELLRTSSLLPSNRHPRKRGIINELIEALHSRESLCAGLLKRPRYLVGKDRLVQLDLPSAPNHFGEIVKSDMEKLRLLDYKIWHDIYIQQVIEYIGNGSQVHLGWGFFNKFMNIPFLKKDLFYRDIFLEDELPQLFENIPEAERSFILRMQISRGRCNKQTDFGEMAKRYLKMT